MQNMCQHESRKLNIEEEKERRRSLSGWAVHYLFVVCSEPNGCAFLKHKGVFLKTQGGAFLKHKGVLS